MLRKSLDLNSLRADFWRRSMNNSPLSSTTSSLICSVVLVLICFNSSSLFAIITTETEAVRFVAGIVHVFGWRRRMPLKEDLKCNGFGRKESVEEEDGEATERFNIVFPRSYVLSDEQQLCAVCVVVADKIHTLSYFILYEHNSSFILFYFLFIFSFFIN